MGDFWVTKQVADYLMVSEPTVTQVLIPEKGLPAYKVGSQFRFKEEKVKQWLEKQELNKKL